MSFQVQPTWFIGLAPGLNESDWPHFRFERIGPQTVSNPIRFVNPDFKPDCNTVLPNLPFYPK